MKNNFLILFTLTALLTSSCSVVGTLYPISRNEKDFIFKKELIGKWGDRKDSSGYYTVDTVNGENGKVYQIKTVFTNSEKNTADSNWLRAILVNINGSYYLDCWLDLEHGFPNSNESYTDWVVARHFIFRILFQRTDKLELAAPNADELIKLVDQKKIILHYATLKKDDYLILDKPAQLKIAIAETKKYPFLFSETSVMIRLN